MHFLGRGYISRALLNNVYVYIYIHIYIALYVPYIYINTVSYLSSPLYIYPADRSWAVARTTQDNSQLFIQLVELGTPPLKGNMLA